MAAPESSSPNSTTELLAYLAETLSAAEPEKLIEIAESDRFHKEAFSRIAHDVAEAYWRIGDPEGVLRWATLPLEESNILTTLEAANIRLVAWALWVSGKGEKALSLMGRNAHRVTDPAEGARWADQRATFLRFHDDCKWTEAETFYHQSLALRPSSDHLGTAMTLQNLAFLYIEHGLLDQAYRFMERTAYHGRSNEYLGANVSVLMGTLGMAWLDLLDGHPIRSSRASAHLKRTGKIIRIPQRGGYPKDLRMAAKALQMLRAWRRGHYQKPSKGVASSFWARIILEQLEVANGKPVADAAEEILANFAKPRISPSRLEFVLTLNNNRHMSARALPSTGRSPEKWPMSYFVHLGEQSTLGAIQAIEQILALYVRICESVVGEDAQLPEKAPLQSRIAALNHLSRDIPTPLGDEVMRISAIADEARAARNRIVHAAPQEADEDTVLLAHGMILEEARSIQNMEFKKGETVEVRIGDAAVDVSNFATVGPEGRLTLSMAPGVEILEPKVVERKSMSTGQHEPRNDDR